MEEQKNNKMEKTGGCGMCQWKSGQCHGCGHHAIIKIVIGIIILGFVFCLGATFGRISNSFEYGGYGRNGYYMMNPEYGQPLMMGWYRNVNNQQPATSTQK